MPALPALILHLISSPPVNRNPQAPRAEGRDSPGGGSSNTKGSVHDEAFLAAPHVPAVSTEAQGPPAVAEGKADAAPAPAPTVGSGRRAV